MAKTTVANILLKIKRSADYNITDSDFDTLVCDFINDELKRIKQWLLDEGLIKEVSANTSFRTVASQAYIDPLQAIIVGDSTTFTGTTDDKVKVTVDGAATDNINIGAQTTIAGVVSAINTAVAQTVAFEDDNGYLMLKSPTSGATSAIVIADGSTTAQTVVADLFSDSTERSRSAITDIDEILLLSERTNQSTIDFMEYRDMISLYPEITSTSSVPDYFSILDEYLYFRPVPSESRTIWLDYIQDITEITSGSTLPFKNKYDPLLICMCERRVRKWLDENGISRRQIDEADVLELKKDLIVGASKNIGILSLPSPRMRTGIFLGPRKSITFTDA